MKNETKDSVKIADFKAHLSQYLRSVRDGHPLTILDRHVPVAQVVPYSGKAGKLVVRKAILRPSQVKLTAPPFKKIDVMRYLAEERQSWR